MRPLIALCAIVLAGYAITKVLTPFESSSKIESNGRILAPIGDHVGVGSYPINMMLSPDGKYVVVSDIGFREQLTLLDAVTGKVLDKVAFAGTDDRKKEVGMYFGLTFDQAGRVYVAQGQQDTISVFSTEDGKLKKIDQILDAAPSARKMPYFFTGIKVSPDGGRLLVVCNQTGATTEYKGALALYDVKTHSLIRRIETAGFPYDVAWDGGKVAWVSSERDGIVQQIDIESGKVLKSIRTGAATTNLLLDPKSGDLYAANSGSDTISIIGPDAKVKASILLRPTDLRGLPGSAPLGMSLSTDGKSLYVALAGLNAVAKIDLMKREWAGMIPTGWNPTSVLCFDDHLLVSSAKGVAAKTPNRASVNGWGQYIENVIEGTVSRVSLPEASELAGLTNQVIANNFVRPGLINSKSAEFTNPGIEYVFYVVKENRTYDNVLGDMPQGNGDAKLTLFPRNVTPNQHALAERFVLLDNFHVCAEVSQDGWVWSTAGMISQYASRNTPYNYSGRGRQYDTEGSNNGVPVDLRGITDVATPASGYLWDNCIKHGVSFRNYGFFTQFEDRQDKRYDTEKGTSDNGPARKALVGKTDLDFRRFDLSYADSEAWSKYGWDWPNQRKIFGMKGFKSRIAAWKADFESQMKSGTLPKFSFLRFGNDHTSGSRAGSPTPQALVADNDYAVGQLVDIISHSSIWKKSMICILEDDAQNGYDHIDAHRSTAYVMSPYIKPGQVDSRFYNTDSMIRTMELALGLPPTSQFDATATPFGFIGKDLPNALPYDAILPPKSIVCKMNGKNSVGADDSAMISNDGEESAMDERLNEILWGLIKGPNTPPPAIVGGHKPLPFNRSSGKVAGRKDE